MTTIVVGVDGSTAAVHALRWAAHLAHRNGAAIDVVHVMHETPTYPALTAETETFPFNARRENERAAAQQVLDTAVTAVTDALEGLEVRTRIEDGDPAPLLAGLVGAADLVVVGTTGVHGHHTTVAGMLDRISETNRHKLVVVPHAEADTFVGYPTHRVEALVPTAHQAHEIHTALTGHGTAPEHIEILASEEGAHSVDAEGTEHGPLRHLLRWIQHFGSEHDVAQRHQRGLMAGEYLVRIRVADEERDDVRRILSDVGAHDATFFGRWTMEQILE